MIPVSRGKPEDDVEIEILDEADLELDLDDIIESFSGDPIYDTLPASPPDYMRDSRRPSGRFSIDPEAESSVVNEWRASIAAAASEAFAADPVIHLVNDQRNAPARKLPPPAIPPRAIASAFSGRLPSVSAPPSRGDEPYDVSDIVDTLPAPRRRKAAAHPTPTPFARTHNSLVPVAIAESTAPSVVVVRRPRLAWIAAAAVIGAIAAMTVMRVVHAPAPAAPAAAVAVAAPPAQTETAVALAAPAPPPVTTPAPATTTVVKFSDDEGVAIAAAPGAPVAAASAHPASSARAAQPRRAKWGSGESPQKWGSGESRQKKPKADDTARKSESEAVKVATPAPAPSPTVTPAPAPPPPAAPRARKLTPEQELAEAQLRAATR